MANYVVLYESDGIFSFIHVKGNEQDKLLAWKAFYSVQDRFSTLRTNQENQAWPKICKFLEDECLNFVRKNIEMDGVLVAITTQWSILKILVE